jgi:hypothetical protein
LVNCAILLTCALVAIAIVRRGDLLPRGSGQGRLEPFKVGDAAEKLPGADYSEASVSLVFYLRTTCAYCTSSMPFYRVLGEAAAKRGDTRLLAVSSEARDALAVYLAHHALRVDRVVQFSGRPLPTSTVLAVDRAGVVRAVWMGQPDDRTQLEILESLAALQEG